MKVRGHLAGEHFDEAGTVHANGLALVGEGLLGDEAAALVEGTRGGHTVSVIEGNEIEALAENENIRYAVSAASCRREIVATGTRVSVRAGKTIEIKRKNERTGRIRQPGAVCSALGQRAPGAFLNGPARRKQFFAKGNELGDGDFIIVADLQVAGDGYFAADLQRRVLSSRSECEQAEREYTGQRSWPLARIAHGRVFQAGRTRT